MMGSPIEFQRELNLARIVRIIPRAGDLRKRIWRQEIKVSGHRELWCVRQIEDLSPKLHAGEFGYLEVLEKRKIQAVKTWPPNLGGISSERTPIRLPDSSSRRGIRERGRVVIMVHVVSS